MRKCNILIPKMCRSTEALTKPIIDRLEKEEWCNVDIIQVFAGQYTPTLNQMEDYFISRDKPDLVFLVGDRLEAGAIAQSSFLNGVPLCHYGSGITNYPISCFDDLVRHQISLVSNILLCEDQNSYERICNLFSILRIDKEHVYIVGNLYLDSINEIDDSLVPKEEYDLVLYNPTTLQNDEFEIKTMSWRKVVLIGPNPDQCNIKELKEELESGPIVQYYDNVSRPLFLGFLKNCKRFITNSSSSYYEAPYFLKPENIIRIGSRNRNRSTDFNEMLKYPNCADNIIKILKEYWFNKQKEVKK